MMNPTGLSPIRTVLATGVVALSLAICAGAAAVAQAASEKAHGPDAVNDEKRKEIRKANDLKFKAREPSFPEQAKARAQDFRATAEIVARQGGDAKPLLDAADYFESQSELMSKPHVQIPDGAGQVPVHVHKPVAPGAAPAH